MKPESRRQRRIRKELEETFGGWWRKIHGGPFQQAGIPDLLGCVGGFFFAFEVKEPGEVPSEIQKDEMEEIREAGGITQVIIEPEEAIKVVRRTLQMAKTSQRVCNRPDI